MAATGYVAYALTGGSTTALDYIDGTGLADGDFAFVFVSGVLYHYILDDDSAAAESSPDIIAPDSNAGDKRWILQDYASDALNAQLEQIAALTIAKGDLLYGSAASTLSNIAIGTADYKLFTNAAGDGPEWANGMKVVSTTFDLSTATGTFNITGAGFKPSAAIMISTVAAKDYFSIGFHAGGVGGSLLLPVNAGAHYIQACVGSYVSGSDYQYFAVSAWIADGVTIANEKVNNPAGTLNIKMFFIR